MSFLDEVTYNVKPGQEVPDTVKDDDVVNIGEKKKDHDGDGDIDSNDYLIARDKAIKKAQGKKVEEGAASKFLGALGIAAALLAVGNQNKSDSVLKAIDAKIEMADTPAEKAALKKLANQRLVWLDTGKGPGGDIKVSDVGDVLKEITTRTNMKENKKTVELPADTTFTLDLKHLMKKHLDEGKSQEDVVKLTKALMKKLHDKGEVKVDGTKLVFKEIKDIKNIKAIIQQAKVNRDKAIKIGNEEMADKIEGNLLKKLQSLNYNFRQDPDAMEVLGDYFDLDELNSSQDTQLALPEPPARDYLGDDGKDYEGGMAKSQLLKMKSYADKLCNMVDDESQLEAWVQAKLTKASDYMSAVFHYLDYQNSKMNEAVIGGKRVDLNSLEAEDRYDDVFTYAEFEDGTPLTAAELDLLSNDEDTRYSYFGPGGKGHSPQHDF